MKNKYINPEIEIIEINIESIMETSGTLTDGGIGGEIGDTGGEEFIW